MRQIRRPSCPVGVTAGRQEAWHETGYVGFAMALIQALLGLLGRSSGKFLTAIFGWAVRALFGETTPTEQKVLSGLVGAAVTWPLLIVGIVAPKVGAWAIAAAPIPKSVNGNMIRIVWIALALLIPLIIGLVVAAKAPAGALPEPFIMRLLRGFPITVGLASAFLIMFISVPILKLVNVAKRRTDVSIPLITEATGYHTVANLIVKMLNTHGFSLRETKPAFWVSAPVKILLKLGGKAFRHYIPERLENFSDDDIVFSMFPSGVSVRGSHSKTAWAHSLITEAVVKSEALQTVDPKAQGLERQIRRVWRVLAETDHHVGSHALTARLADIVAELSDLHIPYDEWQIIYRQVLQLSRALGGDAPLLEQTQKGNTSIGKVVEEFKPPKNVRGLPLTGLLAEIASQSLVLIKSEAELAKTELRADVQKEIGMVKALSGALILGVLAGGTLLVTVIFVLAQFMANWLAGLIVSGTLLLAAGIFGVIGWGKRVKQPLAVTRASIKEDVQWAKERLA